MTSPDKFSSFCNKEYKIGRLKGRFIVAFINAEGKRSRFRLEASKLGEANVEAHKVWEQYWKKYTSENLLKVGQLWNLYRESLGDRSTAKKMESEGKVILPFFGDMHATDINDAVIDRYMSSRKHLLTGAQIADGTLWTELGRLRTALKYAAKKKYISQEDVPYVKRPRKPAPRDRYLRNEEIKLLLRETQKIPHLFLAVQLMLVTAGRHTAILELTWDRVDFENDIINLIVEMDKTPKKGRAKVPMGKSIRKALLEAKKIARCNTVVEWRGRPILSIKTGFNSATERSNLEGVTPHTLRHTAAVRMLAAGSDYKQIAAVLGHTDVRTTERIYAKYHPEHLRREAEYLDLSDIMRDIEPASGPFGIRKLNLEGRGRN